MWPRSSIRACPYCTLPARAIYRVVAFGVLLTRSRPILCWLHIVSLIWVILTEVLPWPCPLTLLEDWLEERRGSSYTKEFMLHYLDKLVYSAVSATTLTVVGVVICVPSTSGSMENKP